MGKVNIEIAEGQFDEIRIKKMKVKQVKKALKKVQEIISIFEEDENTSELLDFFMDMDKTSADEITDEDLQNKVFMENMISAMKLLFDRVPDELTELVSIVSKIEEDIIEEQDYDVFFEIILECVNENDIRSMIDSGKNVFTVIKSKWGGKK